MTARPGPGTPGQVVSATDHRRGIGALIAPGSATDPLLTRSGIVPAPGNPLKVSQNSPLGMSALVQPGNTEIHRTGRGTYTPYNDAVATVNFDAAPAQNSRYDLVYLCQTDSEVDGASTSTLGVAKGTAAAQPTKPYDKLPAGAVLTLAEVGPITTGTTTITDSLITNVAQFAAVRGAPIQVRSEAERNALDSIASAGYPITVERLDTGAIERNTGSGWKTVMVTPEWLAYVPSVSGITLGNGSIAGEYMRVGTQVTCQGALTFGSTTAFTTGALSIGIPLPWAGQSNSSVQPVGLTTLLDTSSNGMRLGWARPSAAAAFIYAGPNGESVSSAWPWTWAAGDSIRWNLTYRTSA